MHLLENAFGKNFRAIKFFCKIPDREVTEEDLVGCTGSYKARTKPIKADLYESAEIELYLKLSKNKFLEFGLIYDFVRYFGNLGGFEAVKNSL